jgi:hypothetical protein
MAVSPASTRHIINSIPTLYAGVRFRSRLEARWAAFFDVIGWEWNYEPFDLYGWIPDFMIIVKTGRPVLVEVKPAATFFDECAQEAKRDIERCLFMSEYESLIVGLKPFSSKYGETFAGWMPETGAGKFSWWDWGPAAIGTNEGQEICLAHSVQSYACRICGSYTGNCPIMEPSSLEECWSIACNKTQWMPKP